MSGRTVSPDITDESPTEEDRERWVSMCNLLSDGERAGTRVAASDGLRDVDEAIVGDDGVKPGEAGCEKLLFS